MNLIHKWQIKMKKIVTAFTGTESLAEFKKIVYATRQILQANPL